MRNPLLMGVMVSALSFVGLSFGAVPASAQVAVDAPIAAPRNQDDAGEPRRRLRATATATSRATAPTAPPASASRSTAAAAPTNTAPTAIPDRGYGVYAEWGYRNGGSSLRGAFDYGRREGYDAGIDAAHYGRYEPFRHRYYRSTRGWVPRFGGRDAYDVNYRNGFRSGYEEGYRVARRSRRW